jgi:hypothetical protein
MDRSADYIKKLIKFIKKKSVKIRADPCPLKRSADFPGSINLIVERKRIHRLHRFPQIKKTPESWKNKMGRGFRRSVSQIEWCLGGDSINLIHKLTDFYPQITQINAD